MSPLTKVFVKDGVATLLLDRPPLNILSWGMQREIRQHAEGLSRREDIRAVVIHGGVRHFAAGADINEMVAMGHTDMVQQSRQMLAAFRAVAAIPKPVAAAITGCALGGGCELALCADVRFAAPDARLGLPEVRLGIIPGAGGTQRLARLIGPARAKDLILTGRQVTAQEAHRIGLIDHIARDGDAYDQALAWARHCSDLPPLALAAAKLAIDQGLDNDLATGLEIERQQFTEVFASSDRGIGMYAFLSGKRALPEFTGR